MSDEKKDKQIEPQDEKEALVDPFAQMFQFYDNFSKSWSGVMSEAVGSKSFAESMSQQMEGSLDTLTLFRRQFGDMMEQYLQLLNLPTRKEITNIAQRLTHLEMALDDLNAKMDDILDLLKTKKK